MDKGISFYFGFANDIETRVAMIKDSGLNAVMTNADKKFDFQNGPIKKQCKLFKKYGLKVTSLHMQYNAEDLPYFWKEGRFGEKLKKILIKDVKIAKKYGFKCVVVHLSGEYSSIGERRLKEVLNVCEKCNVPLAIENIHCQKLFLDTFDHIAHKMLKFCYDSGHNHAFDKDFDYLTKFADKLICLHLHDNDGTEDQHNFNRFGNIDWDMIARKLAGRTDLSLDYELLLPNKGYTIEECLKEVKKQADELEAKILKYSKSQK